MLYAICTKHTVNWLSVLINWLQSISFPHDKNTFKHCCMTAEQKFNNLQNTKAWFVFPQGTADSLLWRHPSLSQKNPNKSLSFKLPGMLQKTSPTVVNMSAHTSGAPKHQGKSKLIKEERALLWNGRACAWNWCYVITVWKHFEALFTNTESY